MFPTSVARFARSSYPIGAPSSTATAAAVTVASSALTAFCGHDRSRHQRRHSSSKTSVPPDSSNRPATGVQSATSSATGGRVGRRRNKELSAATVDLQDQPFSKRYPHLPSVPSTQHLSHKEISLSSLFSCHRPISLTAAVPPPQTDAAFNALFEPRPQNSSKHNDVIFTLANFVENLEGESLENDPNWQDGAHSTHLHGAPTQLPLDKIIAQFKPFRPPPVPVPFEELPLAGPGSQVGAPRKAAKSKTARQKRKSWTTTIVVTEFTNTAGERSWQASSTPMVRIPSSGNSEGVLEKNNASMAIAGAEERQRQPFLNRMFRRQRRLSRFRAARRPTVDTRQGDPIDGGDLIRDRSMREPTSCEQGVGEEGPTDKTFMLISVKRQRKLKMKKHKYKKLQKRTRNLRRRLGKI